MSRWPRWAAKDSFVKEIEEALLDGRIDIAVHSMKDMPSDLPDGLMIGAVPLRENPLDALISKGQKPLEQLPDGARIGTSSLRRSAQLLYVRPDLTIVPLRGNLDTRLNKLQSEDLDAIVLAAAGLKRLGLAHHISVNLAPEILLPAVGQGALCVEQRLDDPAVTLLVAKLNDPASQIAIIAERAFLHRLEGGCQVPMAAHAQIENDRLSITGLVAEIDGRRILKATLDDGLDVAADLGRQLAETLLAQGAGAILESVQSHVP